MSTQPRSERSTNSSDDAWQREGDEGSARLRARREFARGERIARLVWTHTSSSPSRWTIQRGPDTHAEFEPYELRFLNHSCAPNLRFDVARGEVVALRRIAQGEELTFFYPATEWEMADPFECQCGSPNCIGWVRGGKYLR